MGVGVGVAVAGPGVAVAGNGVEVGYGISSDSTGVYVSGVYDVSGEIYNAITPSGSFSGNVFFNFFLKFVFL